MPMPRRNRRPHKSVSFRGKVPNPMAPYNALPFLPGWDLNRILLTRGCEDKHTDQMFTASSLFICELG